MNVRSLVLTYVTRQTNDPPSSPKNKLTPLPTISFIFLLMQFDPPGDEPRVKNVQRKKKS